MGELLEDEGEDGQQRFPLEKKVSGDAQSILKVRTLANDDFRLGFREKVSNLPSIFHLPPSSSIGPRQR